MNFFKRNIPWLLLLLLTVGGAIFLRTRPPEAQVVKAQSRELAEILAVSGQVRGRQESRLAPESSGTVTAIKVEDGQVEFS